MVTDAAPTRRIRRDDRKAAAEIIAAQEADPTLGYREIGEWFGRSEKWVRDIVRWHTSAEHAPPTPFARDVAKVEHTTTRRILRDSTPEQVAEILSEPAVRANVTRRYRERA